MFYRIINNKIVDCAPFKYHEDALFTNKNIIRIYTGELVFEDDFLKNATNSELNKQKEFEESLTNFL